MLKNIIYSEGWSNIRKKPHNIISREEALRKGENGESFFAEIFDDDILIRVISINKDYYSVRFYDENQMLYLIYQFTLINEKLFLTGAYYYEYEEGEKIGHTIFSFKDDGKMLCEKMNYKSNETEEREGIVDVSVNWEDIPEFGDYESIIRTER